jgi:hypothetical protein
MSDDLLKLAAKPFSVGGVGVSAAQIAAAIDRLRDLPPWFKASALASVLTPDESYVWKQEVLNRLFQRWRKLGLAEYQSGKWRLKSGAWLTLQQAALRARSAA